MVQNGEGPAVGLIVLEHCHWILEIHLVDSERRYGGFHEELLDIS
jgi:hypothetical protein